MTPEEKRAIEDFGNAVHEFRAEVDKKFGRDEEKIARLNGRISELETIIARPGFGGGDADNRVNGRWRNTERGEAFLEFCRKGESRMSPERYNVLTVANDEKAGVLAPSEFVVEVLKGATEVSPMRVVARVRQTMASSVKVPKRTGQHAAVWVAESGTRTETTGLTYGMIEIPVHEVYALVDVSTQLLEDSAFDVEGELREEFAEQFGVADGAAFIDGDGAGKPEGFLSHASVGETVSGSAATIADASGQADGLIDLAFGIKTAYARNGTWLLNRTSLGAVRKLKDGDNNYIWRPGIADGVPNTILDRPYVEMPDMPDPAANAYPIAFGDWRRGYNIVDRIDMSLLRDPYSQATSGAVRFLARRRVGGQVAIAEAIRKLKCSA